MNLKILVFSLLLFAAKLPGQIPESAYVVNTVGENLSVINLQNHTVNINAEPLGLYANDIVVKNEKAYVINSGPNNIQIIDLNSLNTLRYIDLANGSNPYSIAFINDSMAVVSLLLLNQVVFINIPAGQIIRVVDVGIGPEGVAYVNGKVYVANTGYSPGGYNPGTVSVIDASNFTVSSIPVGTNPQSLAVTSSGNLAVVCTGDYASAKPQINIIDSGADTVISVITAKLPITAVHISSENKLYLSSYGEGVLVYNLQTFVFERDSINPLPGGPGVVIDRNDQVYLTDFARDSVYVYSPDHQRLHAYRVGDGPLAIALYEPSLNSIIKDKQNLLSDIHLFQNFPNPFNPSTTISFSLQKSREVKLEIYSLTGNKIATLVNTRLSSGSHSVIWDGKNRLGKPAASGLYIYQLQTPEHIRARKMLLLR